MQNRPRDFTLFCWYPDSSWRFHSYFAGIQTLPRDFTAILLVPRLFLEISQPSCWSPDSSYRLYNYPAGIQTRSRDFTAILLIYRLVMETSQLSCWYPYFTAIMLVSRLFLEISQLSRWCPQTLPRDFTASTLSLLSGP